MNTSQIDELKSFENILLSENITNVYDNASETANDARNVLPSYRIVDPLAKFSLDLSLLLGVSVALSMICIFLNCEIMRALCKVSNKTLRSKFIVMSTLFADLLFPFLACSEIFQFVFYAINLTDPHLLFCCAQISKTLTALLQANQGLATFFLAFDRAYAVIFPLSYHMNGYNKPAKVFIVVCIFIVPLSFIIGYSVTPIALPYKLPDGICYQLSAGISVLLDFARFPFVIAISLATFLTYVGVFLAIKFKRRPKHAHKSAANKNYRNAASLAITFFVIHITTTAFYIPAPAFQISKAISKFKNRAEAEIVLRILIMIYSLNAILDSIIFATRIPSIRANLPPVFNRTMCFSKKSPCEPNPPQTLTSITH